jgi:hypothetical protein
MWRGVERRVNRRFSISAPQMAVRPYIPWYFRWGMLAPFVICAVILAWWAYDYGSEFAGFHRSEAQQELSRLRDKVAKLEAANANLNGQIAQYEQKIQIDQAANQATADQLKGLTDENARLQEDLVFFQDLTSASGKQGEVGVHRLTLARDKMPGEYNLRMLLVQGGQRAKMFVGTYQMVATVTEDGKTSTLVFPHDESGNAQFKLSFRYYRRIEQSIQLPPDAQLENIQVRVFEQGQAEPKVKRDVSLSTDQE